MKPRAAARSIYFLSIPSTPPPLRIVPTSPALNQADDFGSGVVFSENSHLADGSPGADAAGSNAGAAYLFEKDLGGAGL